MKIGAPPEGSDARRAAIYVGACAGLLAFSAALLWCASGLPFSLPWYEPLQRAWIISAKPPTLVAMDYFARVALSLGIAAVAAAAVGAFATRRRLSPTLLRAAGIWATAITLFAMTWHAWTFAHRTIHPPPDLPGTQDTSGEIEGD